MTSKPLGVAIVGAGLMGRWHAHCAARAGGSVTAVVDPNPQAAARLARRCPGAAVYSALESCLEQGGIDVVHLCVPTRLHLSLASLALSRDTHVLVEKPMAGSAAESKHLVAMAQSRGRLISPVHQLPFQRGFQQLRLDAGTLGSPTRVTFTCWTAGGDGVPAADRRELLLEVLPHPLSLFYGLFGERVFNTLDVLSTIAGEDLEIGGTLGDTRLVAAISLRPRPTELSLHYLGTLGGGHVDLFHGFYVREGGRVSRRAKMIRPLARGATLLGASGLNLVQRAFRSEWAYPGLRELIRRFYGAIRTGQPAPIDVAEIVGAAGAIDRFRRALLPTDKAATS